MLIILHSEFRTENCQEWLLVRFRVLAARI